MNTYSVLRTRSETTIIHRLFCATSIDSEILLHVQNLLTILQIIHRLVHQKVGAFLRSDLLAISCRRCFRATFCYFWPVSHYTFAREPTNQSYTTYTFFSLCFTTFISNAPTEKLTGQIRSSVPRSFQV